jgi:hypothetical protein
MGKRFDLRAALLGSRRRTAGRLDASAGGHEHVRRDVDTALVIEAARLVVATRLATRAVLQRHLSVTSDVADQLLGRLEHCEVVGPALPGRGHRVIATTGELPGIISEFERRG